MASGVFAIDQITRKEVGFSQNMKNTLNGTHSGFVAAANPGTYITVIHSVQLEPGTSVGCESSSLLSTSAGRRERCLLPSESQVDKRPLSVTPQRVHFRRRRRRSNRSVEIRWDFVGASGIRERERSSGGEVLLKSGGAQSKVVRVTLVQPSGGVYVHGLVYGLMHRRCGLGLHLARPYASFGHRVWTAQRP
ncbi:uncharacterized protein LOC112349917 [Selaginella moellendorffii]|uniref:uncharacterized protein LOC112349917 n=1 Tax=Selaginella moellendorffii TaxID=88036 RepID=UPI000D1CEC3A|nr:uncharacterized protein LOC112349917 [Selaginella moellendorffii]|eukprot:XP_024540937.1 uncharacterized protein LOC112349917 [Selaginella moellendorffii]